MRSALAFVLMTLATACAGGSGGGAARPPGTIVAYQAKSGDVDPSGSYRVRLLSAGVGRDADVIVWLKPDGSGFAATMSVAGQHEVDSLTVRVTGKRVQLVVRPTDDWVRRNRGPRWAVVSAVGSAGTASGTYAPDAPITTPTMDVVFDGGEFTGTLRWGSLEETVQGRRVAAERREHS